MRKRRLTYSTYREAAVVHPQTVHPRLVRNVAENDSADCVRDADGREEVAALLQPERLGLRLEVNVRHVEAKARAEIGQSEEDENRVLEETEVHHRGERLVGIGRNAPADISL